MYSVSHQGYAVYKLEKTGNEKGDDFDTCYVSHLNRSTVASPNEVKDAMTDNEVIVFSNLSILNPFIKETFANSVEPEQTPQTTRFALTAGISIEHGNNKNWPDTP